jgi:hypothetical protein
MEISAVKQAVIQQMLTVGSLKLTTNQLTLAGLFFDSQQPPL